MSWKVWDVNVGIGDAKFTMTLYALPLGGLDMVLGVQWLGTLGPIVCDWKKQTMEFEWDESPNINRATNTLVDCWTSRSRERSSTRTIHVCYTSEPSDRETS